jgi:hypothetical protein
LNSFLIKLNNSNRRFKTFICAASGLYYLNKSAKNLIQDTVLQTTCQEIANSLWNPKDHCIVHKNPTLVHFLRQKNPVCTIPSCLL